MISSNEIEKGLTLDIEGEPYMVLDWQRIGKAQVNVVLRMKLRHLRTHAIIERTLDADQKVRLVPPIISPGDRIRVNTENGEYMERV